MADKIPFKVFLETQNILSGLTTPKLHIEICDWLDNTSKKPRRILQSFRHGGKSYILCCYVAWRLLVDPEYTCIIVSAKKSLAMRNSMLIRSIIESNPLTQHLKSDLYSWQSTQFTVNRETVQLNPSCTVTSITSGFTGMHSTEIIGDDVEISSNVTTEEARKFLRDRVMEFGKISNQVLLTGTPHSSQDLYSHCQSIGYDTVLKKPVYNKEGELAWPDHPDGMFTWQWLERQKNESTDSDFRSQYLLIPSTTYETLMDTDKIQVYEDEFTYQHLPQPMGNYLPVVRLGEKQITRQAAGYDPATGLAGRDDSVLAIVARDTEGFTYVHDIVDLTAAKNKEFDKQCEQIISLCDHYKIGHIFLEENFSPTLKTELNRKAREMKKKIVIISEFRTKNKLNFIAQTIEPLIKVGKMRVHKRVAQSKLMEQLNQFPYMKKDDFLDACALAVSKLPQPMVDVSKIPQIQSPLQMAGNKANLTD